MLPIGPKERSMAWTLDRRRVISLVLLALVIGMSIALRKAVSTPNTRIAIGMVEIILIAILVVGGVRPRQDRPKNGLFRRARKG
jgi:hypothetical protein